MFSFLKGVYDALHPEKDKRELQQKLEEEQSYLDAEIEKEENKRNEEPSSCMQDIIKAANSVSNTKDETESSACFKRVGVVTSLQSNNGTIDKTIFFDINVASAVFGDLQVGCRVEYLAYKQNQSDRLKVVKIQQVVNQYWDEELPTQDKIEHEIAELKKEKPQYFNTHQRNIPGVITERRPDSILIETDFKIMNVNLDAVEIDFIPKAGDCVYVCCNVQSDEHFVDKQGEILQEISVHPTRRLTQEKCTVRKICSNDEWGILRCFDDDDGYFTFDILEMGTKPNVGDIVNADLIECEKGDYVWRCLKLSILETTYKPPTLVADKSRNTNHSVVVSEDVRCIFSATFQKQDVEMTITNNRDRPVRVLSIDFLGRRRDSLLRLIDPPPGTEFELAGGESRLLRFEVEARDYGETREVFVIKLETFKVKRSIAIIVCEGKEAADEERARAKQGAPTIPFISGRNSAQRSRHYANQVYAKKDEVVPGVGLAPKRRFLALRIGYFEVPERLRTIYLTSTNRQEMVDGVEGLYASLKQELNFVNYATRFEALIHLEEIENFVNFRKYDRERAHFTRKDEFLALEIENLAERRPSLVIGDTVRAINPWSGDETDKRCYDGVIHKVKRDHVLLKFNPGFQSKYNGEDYRLEFYFSRFAFRKQQFCVRRIVKHLGESFLFPTKVHMREQVQLDVELDDEENLYLGKTLCPWYNPTLNPVQKRAIRNILRGEASNMAYVIFGPPGTGKTITLVETILQLVKHLPSSRLLVGTPSNSSADLITTRLIESNALQQGDFVRLVSQNQIEKDIIPKHLLKYCATVDMAADGTVENSMITTESGLRLKCQMKEIGRHRISISTCTTLGNFLQMGFPPGHFTHVLIDESGQCTEPEIMVTISQVSQKRGQVVLAGDPHQLQAIVINRFSSERGLSLSFLERILGRTPYQRDMVRFPKTCGFDPRLVTKLLFNYRALPSILNVYNDLFYDSELRPMVSENDSREVEVLHSIDEELSYTEDRPKTHGAFFYGSCSENKQENDSPSWYNKEEAKNVFLMTVKLLRRNILPEQIGIITPYMKQVKHLRSIFDESNVGMPKIGSVEEFQGQERDIILISTVRSTRNLVTVDLRHSLGFVQSSKRMNVAVSRARCLMIVFGNPHLLSMDHCWRTYIKYCVQNGAYSGTELPDCLTMPEDDDTDGVDDHQGAAAEEKDN